MIDLLRNFRGTLRPGRPARRRSPSPAIECLERHILLSAGLGNALAGHVGRGPGPCGLRARRHGREDCRRFYEDYVGPKLAQLDAVAASGQLLPDGNFRFLGVNQGIINPNVPATYVFGVDRSGHLPTGPFPDRPDIRFDATVVVKIVPGQSPTVTVTDLASKTSTTLPSSALRISGRDVEVVVPGSLLPSTGLAPSQYQYDFWPEDGLAGSTNIASFAPEFHDIRVGVGHPF